MTGALHVLTQALFLDPLGGVEVATLQDTESLAERGHRIDVIYGYDGLFRDAFLAAGAQLLGPQPFSFDARRPIRSLAAFLPAVRWARRLRPDVVWLNRVEHLPWGQTVARTAGVPLVLQLHGPPVYRRMALATRGVAQLVAVSEYIRGLYVDRGVDPARISMVHNALPPGRYAFGGSVESATARQRLGLPADRPIVLSYGQMSVAKGIPTLLAAWRRVQAAVPEALLVLVDATSGRPDPAVRQTLSTLDDRAYTVFPGTDDVLPFLHAADVVAFPTALPEAFGRVALEGMTSGRPVIASRIGAIPEILDERFLVAPGSADEFADSLLRLLDWRRAEPSLGAACAQDMAARFPYTRHIEQLETILIAAARSRRTGPRAR